MRRSLRMTAVVGGLAAALAAGCASPPAVVAPAEPALPVRSALEQSAQNIERLMIELQEMRLPEARTLPAGQGITLRFNGEARDVLARLAQMRGLKFVTIGAPALPLPVSLNESNVSLEELLTKIGSQTGHRAWVILDNNRLTLEYRARTSL
jgi:hypothetical protein